MVLAFIFTLPLITLTGVKDLPLSKMEDLFSLDKKISSTVFAFRTLLQEGVSSSYYRLAMPPENLQELVITKTND